jgi:hypothetical protein
MPDDDIYLGVKHHPQLNGLRHDGKRWVDATRPDRPLLEIMPKTDPGQDIFGGSGLRKPARSKAKKPKSRRRLNVSN